MKNNIVLKYNSGIAMNQLAIENSCSIKKIRKVLTDKNIKILTQKDRSKFCKGKNHYSWKGGFTFDKFENKFLRIDGKIIKESVYIWCKHYDIFPYQLPRGFCLHHIDHEPSNNEISNLMLMLEHDHKSLHAYLRDNKGMGCQFSNNKWKEIYNEYLTEDIVMQDLSNKYNISISAISKNFKKLKLEIGK